MQIIDDLPLEIAVFELRYSVSPLIWDSAGKVWSKMLAINPDLTLAATQPNQQSFQTKTIQMSVELEMMKVAARGKQALEDVATSSSSLYEAVVQELKLFSFKRAGLRMILTREFATASEAMAFAGQEDGRQIKPLGEGAIQKGFQNVLRYEADHFGLLTSLKVEERKINLNIPWELIPHVDVREDLKNKFVVSADADYYTIGIIERESFDVQSWVRQAVKTIRRYWGAL